MARVRVEPFWEGGGIRLTAEFHDPETDALVAPIAPVVVSTVDPAGTVATPTVTNPSVGIYRAEFVAGVPGVWKYRVASSGPLPGVDEGTFEVRESQIPPGP